MTKRLRAIFESRVQNGTQTKKSPATTPPLTINSDSEVNAKQFFNAVYKEVHKEKKLPAVTR